METAILFFLGPPATMNDVIEWFERLVTISRDHCMHVYAPYSRFNFCNSLDGAPKQMELQLNCAGVSWW